MPVESFGQGVDGFFSNGSGDYASRDEGSAEVSGGITNDNFSAPLGGGLLVMTTAGVGYVLMKKRKRTLMLLAAVVMLGTTQCKKRPDSMPGGKTYVNITLDVGNNTKIDVNTSTGAVTFVDGDQIIVGNGGKYVGKLTFSEGVFSGTITDPTSDDYLHFYNLGNAELSDMEEGVSTSCSVNISDQINGLPVISYGQSTEKYSSETAYYTARLHNKCALVKFNVSTSSAYAATCIKGMNNTVTVDFSDASFSYSMENEGKIALVPGGGERWAILLPQSEVSEGDEGSAFSGRYKGYRGFVPEIQAGESITDGIEVVVNTLTQPEGALNGVFTVNSAGKQVVFAKSNLSYERDTHKWKFRADQYTTIERDKQNIGNNYGNLTTITLFEWGQTGYDHGAVSYIPDELSSNQDDCFAYGDPNCNLYDHTGKADWGYCVIENGGNINKQWRTLTIDEWDYIFTGRSNASQKYGRAIVNNKYKGVVILPDDWVDPYENCFTGGSSVASTDNSYTLSQWQEMEEAGAVFLPYAGYRYSVGAYTATRCLFTWSSTSKNARNAYIVKFTESVCDFRLEYQKIAGMPVRLVCE